MYVRIKEVSGRRYAYLVEGVRVGSKVRQRTVSYLGPVAVLFNGISPQFKRRISSKVRLKLDWKVIRNQINAIPLKLNELEEMRQNSQRRSFERIERQFNLQEKTKPTKIFGERVEGELAAIAKLSAIGFQRRFTRIGPRSYRMNF